MKSHLVLVKAHYAGYLAAGAVFCVYYRAIHGIIVARRTQAIPEHVTVYL
jgi:hypothetical protein